MAELELRRRRANRSNWRTDFLAFCPLVDIIPKVGPRTKLRLNPIQEKYCTNRTQRDVALKPRQIGFTTLELARDIWTFLVVPGARVAVVCQSALGNVPLRNLSGTIRVMFEGLRASGIPLDFRTASGAEWVLADRDSSLRIIEAGASEASAEKKGRSGTITRLHLTETAFYEYADSTLNALLECVPAPEHGTEIVSESTPNGAAGLFYESFMAAYRGTSPTTAHFFPWWEHPEYQVPLDEGEVVRAESSKEEALIVRGVTPEQLKWYRRKVADKNGNRELVEQEYPSDPETCFLVAGRTFFDKQRTLALLAAATEPTTTQNVGKEGSRGTLRVWVARRPGRTYVVAVDPSEGTGGDPGAAVVYDRATGEHVATLHGQFSTWEMARLVVEIGRAYAGPDGRPALVIVERNNHGHAVLQALAREHKYPSIYVGNDKKPGWLNHETSRSTALDAMHSAHEQGHWSSPDRASLSELLSFVVSADGKPEAAAGAHDDLVLAHAIAWDVCCKPVTHRVVPTGFVP